MVFGEMAAEALRECEELGTKPGPEVLMSVSSTAGGLVFESRCSATAASKGGEAAA